MYVCVCVKVCVTVAYALHVGVYASHAEACSLQHMAPHPPLAALGIHRQPVLVLELVVLAHRPHLLPEAGATHRQDGGAVMLREGPKGKTERERQRERDRER